jgi:hypothetical protein
MSRIPGRLDPARAVHRPGWPGGVREAHTKHQSTPSTLVLRTKPIPLSHPWAPFRFGRMRLAIAANLRSGNPSCNHAALPRPIHPRANAATGDANPRTCVCRNATLRYSVWPPQPTTFAFSMVPPDRAIPRSALAPYHLCPFPLFPWAADSAAVRAGSDGKFTPNRIPQADPKHHAG